MKLHHVIEAQQFNPPVLLHLFNPALEMERVVAQGGTLELCLPGSDGFDRNAAFHFQVMANELSTPKILVCPADLKRRPALNFLSLRPENVSYLLCSGTNIVENNPQEVLAVCPIHNNVVLCDGSVQMRKKGRR